MFQIHGDGLSRSCIGNLMLVSGLRRPWQLVHAPYGYPQIADLALVATPRSKCSNSGSRSQRPSVSFGF